MADEELVTTQDGVWKMDVDAFVPKPEGIIKIKKVEYPIFSFLDIEIDDSLKVARLAEDIGEAEGFQERLDRGIEQILLLNKPGEPRITREIFKGMSPKQVITLTVLASSIAKIPLKAAAKESDSSSPSPSPASAASTVGGEGNSSV